MRKFLTFVSLLVTVGTAHAEFITRVDCASYTAAINDTTACLQTTTVSGRTAGHLYVRRSGAWVDVDTSGTGAPTDATYITQTANGSLSAEQALGVLTTGILKSTTTTGVVSIAVQGTDYYAPGGTDVAVADGGTGRSTLTLNGVLLGNGTSAINMTDAGTAGQVLTSNGAGSPPTFQAFSGGGVTSVATNAPLTGGPITTTGTISCPTCLASASAPTANQLIIGLSGQNVQSLGSLGTTTTVLHGNAGGAPTFGAVSLTADVTGALPVNNGGTGLSSGTSGGIPYFSASNTIASSGALTANLPVIGGGAGTAPTVGTRSGNTTAFVTTTGSLTSGRCVQIDANGNFVQAAAACAGGGGIAGSDTEVQFNDGGSAFGADAGLTYNKTTDALTVAGLITVPKLVLTKEIVSPVTETTMSGNATLAAGTSNTYQFFDPNGSDRDVTLPATATGLTYLIMHIGSANTITIKANGGATVTTAVAGQARTLVYSGSAWRVM